MKHRHASVMVIIGRNCTGKSTFCEQIVKKIGGRTLVVTMNGLPKIWRPYPVIDPAKKEDWNWKKGIRQVYFAQHEEETFKYIYKYFHGGNLVFDDCRDYITARVDADIYLKRLFINFRHKELDIFVVAHSPGDVPKQIWMYAYNTFVGATNAMFNKSQIPLGNAEEIIRVQRLVNVEFRRRLARGDGGHYGLFVRVVP